LDVLIRLLARFFLVPLGYLAAVIVGACVILLGSWKFAEMLVSSNQDVFSYGVLGFAIANDDDLRRGACGRLCLLGRRGLERRILEAGLPRKVRAARVASGGATGRHQSARANKSLTPFACARLIFALHAKDVYCFFLIHRFCLPWQG
jgi:hypothetical protein